MPADATHIAAHCQALSFMSEALLPHLYRMEADQRQSPADFSILHERFPDELCEVILCYDRRDACGNSNDIGIVPTGERIKGINKSAAAPSAPRAKWLKKDRGRRSEQALLQKVLLKVEDLMLGAAEFDAAGEFIQKLHSLLRKYRQKAVVALLQFTVGIKMSRQLTLVGVEN